ncbi:MAG: DUF4124 domain-containing protein [Pseudomonadota bacterium]
MKHHRMARAMPLLLAGALLAGAPAARAQYIWLDDKGLKQLSDQPPPPSVPQNRILKQPRQPGGAPATNAAPPAAAADGEVAAPDAAQQPKPKLPASVAERNADYTKRRAEAQASEQKATQEAAKKAEQASNCESVRNNQRALDDGIRMTTYDKSGQRVIMSDAERAQQAKRNQAALANCTR